MSKDKFMGRTKDGVNNAVLDTEYFKAIIDFGAVIEGK